MKPKKGIWSQINIFTQCKEYNLPLWECPQFLFMVMGVIVIASATTAYAIGSHYINDPLEVTLIVLLLASVLFAIAVIIVRSFERLAEANRMKSEFVSVVSHQLRSPLSNLRWGIELLMSGKLGKIEEKQLEYFKILKENNSRMRELISDLLTVSRIETAKLALKRKSFSLEKIVKKLIAEYEPFAKASNVQVVFTAPDNLPEVISDPFQISLVLENFIDNAIRYIKDKGKVEIKLSKEEKYVRFSIADNGVGIPEKDQKYIFQKFFRSENIVRYQTQGSGLGLYISKEIIKRAKGKIGFKSQEGKGSTFWFALPIKS